VPIEDRDACIMARPIWRRWPGCSGWSRPNRGGSRPWRPSSRCSSTTPSTFLALLTTARSAELASAAIRRFLPDAPTDLDRVSRLILLTTCHGHLALEDVDRDAALFLDCDMAILGASPAVFDAYHAGICAFTGCSRRTVW
jgi:hypothetical protein